MNDRLNIYALPDLGVTAREEWKTPGLIKTDVSEAEAGNSVPVPDAPYANSS